MHIYLFFWDWLVFLDCSVFFFLTTPLQMQIQTAHTSRPARVGVLQLSTKSAVHDSEEGF